MTQRATQPSQHAHHKAFSCTTRALFVYLALLLAQPISAAVDLPMMGEPADRAMSPQQEKQIGRQFMRYARAQLPLIEDPQLEHYLQQLGERLLASGVSSDSDYHFFLLNNPELNAFATPGGYIGVHSGLILAATNESQLASVLAHEIAHVDQRHIARAIAESSGSELTTLAAVIAAIIVAQHDPQAAQAAISTGIASSAQSRIDFTRAHEAEADRIGINILAQAGFAPGGMSEFFATLQSHAELNGELPYEFLRTHPLSSSRVAEAQSRALALSNAQQHSDSQGFQLMRARVEVLTATDPVALQRKFAKRQPQKLDDSVNRYAQALLALRLNQIDLAEEHARQGKAEESDELAWQTLLAEIDSAAGREQKAIARWEALSAVYPHYSAATTELARLLEQTGRTDEAQARLLNYLRGQDAPHPRAWQQLARIRQQTGDQSGSAEALAEYYLGIDAPAEALLQMRRALRLSDAQSAARQRLEARIAQVESDKQREQETATR